MKKSRLMKLFKMMFLLPLIPLMGIPTDGGAAGDGAGSGDKGPDSGDGAGKGDAAGGEGAKKPDAKTHTQAEVDQIVKDRVARERAKHKKTIDDMQKQFNGDDGAAAGKGDEGAKPPEADPNAAAQQAAEAKIQAANQRLIQATATTEAVKMGVDPKYSADVVQLAAVELAKITVADDGSIDTAAIDKALDTVLKRLPMFKATADNQGGFKVGGDGKNPAPSANGWTPSAQPTAANAPKPWNKTNR